MGASSSAWQTWVHFRRESVRSSVLRWLWLSRGVYVGEGARIPGAGRLELARSASVQRYAVLNAQRGATIRLGAGSRVGAFAVISAVQSIDIGDDVLIADRVFIADHSHGFTDPDTPVSRQGVAGVAPVSIGAGCWVGINVCVMPGVSLGRGCIVGAGSVVTRSFPAGSIVAGAPARLIRERTADVR